MAEKAPSQTRHGTAPGAQRPHADLEAPDSGRNAPDREGRLPLHRAVEQNDWAAVTDLLKKGADANAWDEKTGLTPLGLAVDGDLWTDGDWGIVDALLEAGADPTSENGYGYSLLSEDNLRKCFAGVLTRAKERFLEQQWYRDWEPVDEQERNRRRDEARDEAKRAVELYEQLRKQSDRTHEQAMELVYGHLGSGFPLYKAVNENDLVAITLLLDAGADPNDGVGFAPTTPLLLAVDTDNLPVLVTLLAAGADPDGRGDRETPLYYAIDSGNLPVITVLLNAGADPNFYSLGETYLHHAVQRNDLAVLAALLNAKANPNAQNKWGKTPLHYAAASEAPVEETLLIVELLLNAGADSNVEDWYYGWNAVHEADHNQDVEDNQKIVRALLEDGLFSDAPHKRTKIG